MKGRYKRVSASKIKDQSENEISRNVPNLMHAFQSKMVG